MLTTRRKENLWKESISRNTKMSSVYGSKYCNGIHLYMLWPSPGIVLLLRGEISQLHEAQAHVSHEIVSICTVLMFTLPNRTHTHYYRGYTSRNCLRTTALESPPQQNVHKMFIKSHNVQSFTLLVLWMVIYSKDCCTAVSLLLNALTIICFGPKRLLRKCDVM